jgi:muconolactone delta-isomerase
MQFVVILRRRTEQFEDHEFARLLDPEAQRVRELYAEGIVRSIWSRQDVLGAVILLECPDEAAANAAIASLPLAQRGMLEFTMVPLRGYRGFCP